MARNIWFAVLMLVSSCNQNPDPRPQDLAIDGFYGRLAVEVSQLGLHCSGSYGELMIGVKSVGQTYVVYGDVDLEMSRDIYVNLVKCVMAGLEADEALLPFLKMDPSDYRRVRMMLEIRSLEGAATPPTRPTLVRWSGPGVLFLHWDPRLGDYIDLHKETWEEAQARCRVDRLEEAMAAVQDTDRF